MKGYIYSMFKDADPGKGWTLTDPIFGKVPTLGACMPNIRRVVAAGDHVFALSGRMQGVKQYVVGGFEVDEKIDALAAYRRLPENRQVATDDGTIRGNIIVDAQGNQVKSDYHSNFERRIENYVIGKNPIVLAGASEVEIARAETEVVLKEIFKVPSTRTLKETLGRWRKLDGGQIEALRDWMTDVKLRARAITNE